MINAGIYLFKHQTLQAFPTNKPQSFEKEVFQTLLAQNLSIGVHSVKAPFHDIGTPETLEQSGSFIQNNISFFTL